MTRNAIAVLAVAACMGLLAGCGSSGESASSGGTGPDPVPGSPPSVTPDPDPPPPPAAWEPTPANIRAAFPPMKPPTVSPEEALAMFQEVLEGADSILLSDTLEFVGPRTSTRPPLRSRVTCEGLDCSEISPDGERGDWTVDLSMPVDIEFVMIGEEDGIFVAYSQTSETWDDGEDGYESSSWGGWATYSTFSADWTKDIAPHGNVDDFSADSFSLGQASGSNPHAVFASWWGYVAGVDVGNTGTRGNAILGRARIMFDNRPPWPPSPSVDVKFFQMRDLATGEARAEMHWPEIPLSGGAFAQGEDDNSIQGRFYGPRHEEVGGVFERNDISGAFGATQGVTTAR